MFRGLTSKIAGAVLFLIFVTGCSQQQFGLPRIAVEGVSPDGAYRAWVKNHLSIDPPAQSLWIRDVATEETKRILLLVEDQDWCNTIVWSADNGKVVFLVQDARAVVYDPVAGAIVNDTWLVPKDGYPTTRCVRDLEFDSSDRTLVFRECLRKSDDCSDRVTFSLMTRSRVEENNLNPVTSIQ